MSIPRLLSCFSGIRQADSVCVTSDNSTTGMSGLYTIQSFGFLVHFVSSFSN
jgi:hypothetical protein